MTYAAAQIDALVASNMELAKQLKEVAELMLRQSTRSPWMTAREAADYIGINTRKKNYPRKLSWLIRQGYLIIKEGKPRMYSRESVEQVAQLIAAGRIGIIGQV